ncbi:DUF2442 domain-containing protein [Francisella sp. TX07-6608]|uniref:DUF2442 domain-containing protein n=1 Tax=Francisella sp. TX07-6608 TaxID=573568 RepID=UPI0008F990E1|nr:DUF2442 domain-containing protein [Francisella sp. TX07-6608]OIN82978.1 hypothetical protein KX00_2086 [Francisella sp. TX07-6608]
MSISVSNPLTEKLAFNESDMTVYLKDGRKLIVPLVFYSRLANATQEQLNNYFILGDGEGIHWSDLDEDLSTKGLLLGNKSSDKVA